MTAVIACPAWCNDASSHDHGDEETGRRHTGIVGDFDTIEGHRCDVWITGCDVNIEPVQIDVAGELFLTAGQARELAAVLLVAARRLDEIS